MLHICLRIPGQSYDELPFEEEIMEFLWFLRHSAQIRMLTDLNINKLFQPWRSFGAVINKCLTGKNFVYQVEHKNQKKSNEMYYPRFTKVIIHHFMSKDLSILRRNKGNWHYVRDDIIFLTIKVVSRHQNTQQYGVVLPIELTNEEIRNTKAYKEYYACATREAAPKPKASARRKRSGSYTSITPPTAITTPTTTVAVTPRLTVAAKGKQPAKAKSGFGTDEETGSKPGVPNETKSDEESDGDETREDESFDPIPKNPEDSEDDVNGEEDQGLMISEEERIHEEKEADELYRDVDINQGRGIQLSQATITSISHAPIPPTIIPSEVVQNPPTFDSVFRFDERLKSLKASFSKYRQTNLFAKAVSNISGIVHQYLNQQINKRIIKEQVKSQVKEQVSKILPRIEQSVNAQLEAEVLTRSSYSSRTSYVITADLLEMEQKKNIIEKMEGNKSIQRSDEQRNLYKALVEAYEADKIILDTYRERFIRKRRRDDQGEGPSAGSDRGSKRQREGKEPESGSAPLEPATRSAGRSTTGFKSRKAAASESAFVEEPVQTTSQIEEPSHSPKKPPTPDRDWNKTLSAAQGSTQTWISELEKQADSRSSFNEILDTPLDFSNFIMNRLRVDTLTLELLAGPTYELMKGSFNILTELENHLEEVYKATTDQLDWVNPEGQQYPHNLLQPLPLIPDNRGRRIIPFAHFINNDLEYLRGGASSRKYTKSVTKTKAAGYGHIKWIEDLVPRTMWIQEPINYGKHALWGRWIISVTDLKIVEWHNYKHLDWILGHRDDDKIYKFKEGDFKRLCLQDIEDMLLLRVQGKLSNLTVEEHFAFNVSLWMFTRSIVIQQRVEDLQLGIESYQKRLNLTKPDTYRSDLKRREAYTAYSNPRGFIYQNKDKKHRLMIDELYKFSDGTLNDVRNALDDRLKGIRMQYLPQTIWRKGDKDRAAAMIQAINKMLKTKRIMRSLERFVGGRLYEVDFQMLQRTI
nr:hypothetical protein [Tanacetum cinerariifolium]